MYAPIVMIAFNRPAMLKSTLERLSQASGVEKHDIFMFVDGPRNELDAIKQKEIMNVLSYWQTKLPRIKTYQRSRNYGCRGNIVDAITQIISQYGRAIVIEDDILISRTFLEYMDRALDFYNDDKRIWSINAYQSHNVKVPRDYPYDVYLDPINMCWGWGTWYDRWREVDFDLRDWPRDRNDSVFMDKLNKVGRHLAYMIDLQYEGKLNTWDVQCTYHVVKHDLMSIEPRYQLSKNIGFSSKFKSEHCQGDRPIITRQKYYDFSPRLERDLIPDKRILHQIEWVTVPENILMRIIRKLQRIWAYTYPPHMEPLDVVSNR